MKYTKAQMQKFLEESANPREELHSTYKQKMKDILLRAISKYLHDSEGIPQSYDYKIIWIDQFVEAHFEKE